MKKYLSAIPGLFIFIAVFCQPKSVSLSPENLVSYGLTLNQETYKGSYTDLVPGEWTKVKIEVKDDTAKLYVNDAEQPALIVNDLKQYWNLDRYWHHCKVYRFKGY